MVMARICPEAASRSRAPCVVSERVLNSASWEPVASSELASAKISRSLLGLLMSGANEASDSVPNSSLAMPACSASGIFLMAPSTVSRVFSASLPPFFMPSAMAPTLRNPNCFIVSFWALVMALPWLKVSRKFFMAVPAVSLFSEVDTIAAAKPTMDFSESPAVFPTAPIRATTEDVSAAVAFIFEAT